jgi:hypothetical protein
MKITLQNGREFQIDECDIELVKAHKWNVHMMKKGYKYVYRFEKSGNKRVMIYLHRQIMSCENHLFVDHINGDTLDNRRSNLRVSTNRGVVPFKGVTFENGKYRSRIRINGKKLNVGRFDTAQEASEAYDKASKEAFGSYSYT